jgi:hypothetical protein
MTRYRRIAEHLRRPVAAIGFLIGLGLLAEALWLGRGGHAYLLVLLVVGGSVVNWLVPSGRRVHSPSESTLRWAHRQRRERG